MEELDHMNNWLTFFMENNGGIGFAGLGMAVLAQLKELV